MSYPQRQADKERATENDVYDSLLLVADVAIEDNEEETIYPTQKKVQTSSLSPSTSKLRNIDYDEYYQEDFSLCEYLFHS